MLGEFCIMPNHIHGIVVLTDSSAGRGGSPGRGGFQTRPYDDQTTHPNDDVKTGPCVDGPSPPQKRHGTPEIVRALKSFSSRRINQILDSPGAPVWQRNYYEHIIRNDGEHQAIQGYILNNPLNWDLDEENPLIG